MVVLGVIGSLAMLVPAAVAPQMVGPWWIYAATFVGSIAFGVHTFRRNKVMVRVAGDRLRISGPAVSIDSALDGEADHWISFVKGAHVGAKRIVQYNAVVGSGGRRLGFWNLFGAEGSQPADWPVRTAGVSDCNEQFMCPRIDELVRAIRKPPSAG